MGWIVITILTMLIVIPAIGYAIYSNKVWPVKRRPTKTRDLNGRPTTRCRLGQSRG